MNEVNLTLTTCNFEFNWQTCLERVNFYESSQVNVNLL